MFNKGFIMTDHPKWTWRLRADSNNKWLIRIFYKLLRSCTDKIPFVNDFLSICGLVFGIYSVVKYIFISPITANVPVEIQIVSVAAVFFAAKALVSSFTTFYFRDKKLIGGSPTEDNFENLVPLDAKKVALVGQNLGSRFDNKYDSTCKSIKSLLSRKDKKNDQLINEFLIVLQTPLSLLSVHPAATRHLQTITIKGLRRLSTDLEEKANKIWVAFHPAATLSMLVVDWHLNNRLAIVTPKVQTTPMVNRRASLVLTGEEFDTVAPHFDQFLAETNRKEYPGACMFPLTEAANELENMFLQDTFKVVKEYINKEECRIKSIS